MTIFTDLWQPISKKNLRHLAELINSHWKKRLQGQSQVFSRRKLTTLSITVNQSQEWAKNSMGRFINEHYVLSELWRHKVLQKLYNIASYINLTTYNYGMLTASKIRSIYITKNIVCLLIRAHPHPNRNSVQIQTKLSYEIKCEVCWFLFFFFLLICFWQPEELSF